VPEAVSDAVIASFVRFMAANMIDENIVAMAKLFPSNPEQARAFMAGYIAGRDDQEMQ
jgi:hypothetical protein